MRVTGSAATVPPSRNAKLAARRYAVPYLKDDSHDQTPLGYNPRGGFDMGTDQAVIRIDPEILSGTPCFAGTRVPIQTLMDYLKAGDRLSDFLDDFPTVTRQQVNLVLEIAGDAVTRHARTS